MIATRRWSLRRVVFLVVVAFGAAHPATRADAEETSRADPKLEAARTKREADALMDQDKYAEAYALYVKAFELSNDPALIYNQGRALEALGEYPEAIDKLEQFDREAPPALKRKVPGLREHLADLRNRVATLVVTTNVPGARLFIREKAAGTLSRETRVRTRAGRAALEVAAEGYEPFHKDVELAGGATVAVHAELSPKKNAAPDALLVVRTKPPADIALDDRALGRAPLEARVPAGSYVLFARAEGHVEEKVPMTLSVGDRREVDLALKESAPITARWWFWTGLALVAAGGVATYVVLTTERDPDRGTFAPGTIAAP